MDVPHDQAGTFEPQIVKKRQCRLTGVDDVVLSLYTKVPTTGEIGAHATGKSRSVAWRWFRNIGGLMPVVLRLIPAGSCSPVHSAARSCAVKVTGGSHPRIRRPAGHARWCAVLTCIAGQSIKFIEIGRTHC
jgi:hypothetical protein